MFLQSHWEAITSCVRGVMLQAADRTNEGHFVSQRMGIHTHHLGHTKNDNIGVLCEGDLNKMENKWWINSKKSRITVNLSSLEPTWPGSRSSPLPERRASLRGTAERIPRPYFDAHQSSTSAFQRHPGPHLPIFTMTPSRHNCALLSVKSPTATCFTLRPLQTSNLPLP